MRRARITGIADLLARPTSRRSVLRAGGAGTAAQLVSALVAPASRALALTPTEA